MAKRDLISFGTGDVIEVVIRCRNCGSGQFISVNQAQAVVPSPSHCPGCMADWAAFEEYREHRQGIGKLLDALRLLSQDRDPLTVEMVIKGYSGDVVQGDS